MSGNRAAADPCAHVNVQSECHIPGACQVLPPVCLDCGETLESDAVVVVTMYPAGMHDDE